ncbi:6-phosphogluconolactonase [Synechococcus sp. PCC 7336]|uniref:6-phosphogluconolactonase n=1 Tax=Synechococcus sp. PCC 7336 TaxID=195250 RepID=UPI00034CF652|nr:6-phosphogluconolactonase [Synechococcus sp. PCC 7336]
MVQSWQLDIRPDVPSMVQRGIELWQQWAAEAIAERGCFSVALSGGSSPKVFYEGLASADLPWDKLYVFWGDERYVPQDHPDSNYRMAKQALLDRVPIPASQIFPFPTGAGNPQVDAATYGDRLREVFKGDWPEIDCTLLGVGGDGHTASLFPATEALNSQAWVTVGNKSGEPRLTLTFPALNASRRVVFWLAGAGKAEIVKTLLTTNAGLPAQSIQPHGELIWLCDRTAAAALPLVGAGP